ncbi:MAG: AI-2E family transporter [Chloroflexota bacterium]
MKTENSHPSPLWSGNVKLVVGITIVAVVAAFLIRFHTIIAPLILTFITSYLLHPLIAALCRKTTLTWRMSVNIVFLVLVVTLVTSFALTGLALIQQLESLVNLLDRFINDLPSLVKELVTTVYHVGTYQIDLSNLLSSVDLDSLIQEVIGAVSPLIGQAGGLLRTVASQTLNMFGWGFFIILVSYFLLADMEQVSGKFVDIEVRGFDADIRRLSRELERIWNAFLRGQVLLFTLTVLAYTVLLAVLGVRYVLGLALLAGFSRFLPYIGPLITWIVTILVAVFQGTNYFGLEPWQFALLVFGLAVAVDQVFDNIITPRVLGRTLGVHPAAVLIATIVGASLLGLVGVVLAAPVLSSLTLGGRYIARKMLGLYPWPDPEKENEVTEYPWHGWVARALRWIRSIRLPKRK